MDLKLKRYAEIRRPNPRRSFWPLRSGHPCRSRALPCWLANVRQIPNLCRADDVCALQRRETPSPAVEAARSHGLSGITAAREAKRAKSTAAASSAAAPVDFSTDPPPAGRFRRSCRTSIPGALEPATAAAVAAPDVAAAAERPIGLERRATSSPDECLKLLALAGYCNLHACADAQSRTADCAVGPPAAAPISASAAEQVRPWPLSVLCPPRPCVHMHAAPSCGACTLDRLDRCIDPAAVRSPPSWSPLMRA